MCLTAALFGSGSAAVVAFPMMGLFASVMWPILVSLALNSVSEFHGSFAGILSTGIVGGAIVPLIIARIGDIFGLRVGLMFLYFTLGSAWARTRRTANIPLLNTLYSDERSVHDRMVAARSGAAPVRVAQR
jgi:fucose permease